MEDDRLRILLPHLRRTRAVREQVAVSGYPTLGPPRLSMASQPAFTNVSIPQCVSSSRFAI